MKLFEKNTRNVETEAGDSQGYQAMEEDLQMQRKINSVPTALRQVTLMINEVK